MEEVKKIVEMVVLNEEISLELFFLDFEILFCEIFLVIF